MILKEALSECKVASAQAEQDDFARILDTMGWLYKS